MSYSRVACTTFLAILPLFAEVSNVSPIKAVRLSNDLISGSGSGYLSMRFDLSQAQKEELDQLLRDQQTPGSPRFHKFLTSEEFGARFAPSGADLATVQTWLQTKGFANVEISHSKTSITFSGSAAQAQSAFGTLDAEWPATVRGTVQSVSQTVALKQQPRVSNQPQPHLTGPNGTSHLVAPDDFTTIYNVKPLYAAGLDGTGVKIAVVGQSSINLADIQAFRSAAGLSANNPQIISAGSDPGFQTGDEATSDRDIEWAGAIARNATIVFVNAPNVYSAIQYAIENNVAPILAVTYGSCEASFSAAERAAQFALYQQANAQGVTVVAASGSAGAADCDRGSIGNSLAVDLPAAFPNVTGIGGTAFTDQSATYWQATNNAQSGSVRSYIPETSWNETTYTLTGAASGGGASKYYGKPSWQKGIGVPNDGARDVPDLALNASAFVNPYVVCSTGSCVNGFAGNDGSVRFIGGASAGAPNMAGILALLVQRQGPQGNINPTLYKLAALYPSVFHDVTTGNNNVPCVAGQGDCPASGSLGFSAGAGYDQVTGLGSVDANALVTHWQDAQNALDGPDGALGFMPITPCRIADTRGANGSFGGPKLPAGGIRSFLVPKSVCNIPTNAAAYALNVTVIPDGVLGYLSLYPSGAVQPSVSTLNSDGRVKANAGIVPAGVGGGVDVYATHSTQVVIDINGYFVPRTGPELSFFPLTPCRISDTRSANAPLGGPSLSGAVARSIPVLSSNCQVPSNAQAYSLNFTVVPHQVIGYFTAWPSGQAQPPTSVLNTSTVSVTANAAIIPAGQNGAISVFSSSDTELVVDINGYFASTGANALSFHTLTPCRTADTRSTGQPFTGIKIFDARKWLRRAEICSRFRDERYGRARRPSWLLVSLARRPLCSGRLHSERRPGGCHIEHGSRANQQWLHRWLRVSPDSTDPGLIRILRPSGSVTQPTGRITLAHQRP